MACPYIYYLSTSLMQRECLACGMPVTVQRLQLEDLPPRQICLKCDSDLYAQSSGSCVTRDIAHHHETVTKAMQKLEAALIDAWQGTFRTLRLVVGGGLIRNEVLGQLRHYQQRGYLLDFGEESPNRGAILVRLRN